MPAAPPTFRLIPFSGIAPHPALVRCALGLVLVGVFLPRTAAAAAGLAVLLSNHYRVGNTTGGRIDAIAVALREAFQEQGVKWLGDNGFAVAAVALGVVLLSGPPVARAFMRRMR